MNDPKNRFRPAIAAVLLALGASTPAHAGEELLLSEAFAAARMTAQAAAPDRTTYLLGVYQQRLWQLKDEERRIEIALEKNRQDVGFRTRMLRDRAKKECGAKLCDPDPRAMTDEQIIDRVKDADLMRFYVFFSGLGSKELEIADLHRQALLLKGELARVKASAEEVAAEIAALKKKTPR